MTTYITIQRIIREDVAFEMQPGETPGEAEERAIAMQADLIWECFDCDYNHGEPYEREEAPAALEKESA